MTTLFPPATEESDKQMMASPLGKLFVESRAGQPVKVETERAASQTVRSVGLGDVAKAQPDDL